MNDKNFEFEFMMWNYNPDNFKKKQIMILLGVIGGSKLGKHFKFSGYGNMTFSDEDTGHRYPLIEMQEKYNRNKTNVLVFDMPATDRNIDGLYDDDPNKNKEAKSYNIKIEAVSNDGTRVDESTVYVTSLGSGQSVDEEAFTYIASDKLESVKNAKFKVLTVLQY